MDSLGGGTDDLEIIANLAMYVGIAAALTLGVREWGEWDLLWRALLAVIVATPLGQLLGILVLSPLLLRLRLMGLWMFSPFSSAYILSLWVRILAAIWCCRLLGASFGWF